MCIHTSLRRATASHCASPAAEFHRSEDSANDFKMLLQSLAAEDDLQAIEGEGPGSPFAGSGIVTDERVLPVIAMGKGSLLAILKRERSREGEKETAQTTRFV